MIKILVLSVLAVATFGMVGCSSDSEKSTSTSTYQSAPVDSKGMSTR